MGHKVNPNGFRLGIIKGWDSRWYANRNYKDLFSEDRKLRDLIRKRLHNAAVSKIEIERVAGTQLALTIHTAKPGIVIGKNGESVERLRQDLEKTTKKKVRLNILEIRTPDLDAYLVARSIAEQLEKRVSFRRAMKQSVQKTMRAGAKGIKVVMGGRLGGAEIARTEKEVEGSVPLQTLRANIDYGLAEAHTTFGVIGVKVWIYHGDILPEKVRKEGPAAVAAAVPAGAPAEREGRGERGGRGFGGDRGERGFGGERGERGPRTGGPGGERRPPRAGGPAGERGTGAPRGAGAGAGGDRRPPRAGGPAGERGAGGPRAGGPGTGPANRATAERPSERRVSPTAPQVSPSDPNYNELRSSDYVGEHKGPGPERVPSEKPSGAIETGVGPALPSSGPVTPSPAGEHEFPAPTANEQANPVEPAKPLVGSADGMPEQVEPGKSAPESPRSMGDKEGAE